jgi:hypothetical protein
MIVDKLTVVGGNWKEPNVSVRDTCAWALGKIVLNHITLVEASVLEKIVDVAVLALKDEPRVVVNACYVCGLNQLVPFLFVLKLNAVAPPVPSA